MCGKGSSGSTQSQTSSTLPNAQALEAYQNLIGRAQGIADTPWNPATAQQVAGFTPDQLAAFDQARGGISQPYINNAAQMATAGVGPVNQTLQQYLNPHTQNVIDATQRDFDVANQRQISGVTGDARMRGSLGGDREQVAKALTSEAQTRAQAPVIAGLHSQGYSQALQAAQNDASRQLQGAGIMGNLSTMAGQDWQRMLGIGGMQQGLDQQRLDAASGNAAAQSAYPFQTAQWLAGILGSATPNMGSTTTSTGTRQGPTPNTWSQLAGLGIAALPYLHTGGRVPYAYGGGVSDVLKGIAGSGMLGIAPMAFADGVDEEDLISPLAGLMKMKAAGGGVSYVPQFQMQPGRGLQPSGGAMRMDGDNQKQKGFADHYKDIQDTAKSASGAFKGIDTASTSIGNWMRTSTDPNVAGGWGTTTTTYADPWANAGYAMSNTFGGIGTALGFASGGGVDDNDPAGSYDAAPAQASLPMQADYYPPLVRQAFASPGISPLSDLVEITDAPQHQGGFAGAPPNAGEPYAPPPPPVNVLNPAGGGVGAMPAPAAPSPSGGGILQRFGNWLGTDEAKQTLGTMGMAMMAGSGVGGRGSFGVHLGQGGLKGLEAQSAYRKGEREKDIEAGKMALAQRAAQVRDNDDARAAAMHPYDLQAKQADITAKRAAVDASKVITVDPSKLLYDSRTKQWITPPGGAQSQTQAIFDKKFAEKAPELLEKSAQAYADADSMVGSIRELSAIAPYAETGWGQEQVLALRKMGARLGLDVSDKVAPTELFRSLSQNFVLQAAQKLKPLSNSDVQFVQRGLATIESDPSTLKSLLPGMDAVAKRSALGQKLQMDALRRGQVPDYVAIAKTVDEQIPSPIVQEYGQRGIASGAATPSSGSSGVASRAPSETQAAASEDVRQRLLALPEGSVVLFKGKPHIKNGTTLSPAPEGTYRRGFFGTISDMNSRALPSFP